jgi:hypothetical protein
MCPAIAVMQKASDDAWFVHAELAHLVMRLGGVKLDGRQTCTHDMRGLPSRIAPCRIGNYLQGASASGPEVPSGAGGLGEPGGAQLVGDSMDQVCRGRWQ